MYRQVANTRASRVEDGVGDGGSATGDSDLADAFDASWIDVRIVGFNYADVDVRDICVRGNEIVAEICIHHACASCVE